MQATTLPMVWLIALAMGGALSAAEPVFLTIKAVKAAAGRGTAPPVLKILSHADLWRERNGATWNGENDWEAFLTITADATDAPLPRLAMTCPGVEIARVIVGHTDVAFEGAGARVEFDAVADRSAGTLISNTLPDPLGTGWPIGIYHNWRIRADGPYALSPYPEAEARAVLNYLLAAREALRRMGGIGPRDQRPFEGTLNLLSFEVACGRGHNDFPPHVHIMLYVPGYTPGSQVPHFYMDARGRIVRNGFTELGAADSKRSGVYMPGDVCRMVDRKGMTGLECTITPEGGLVLSQQPGEGGFLLIGDDVAGPAEKVWVVHHGAKVAAATSSDDAGAGVMTATVENFENGECVSAITQTMRYDPFTGRVIETKADRADTCARRAPGAAGRP